MPTIFSCCTRRKKGTKRAREVQAGIRARTKKLITVLLKFGARVDLWREEIGNGKANENSQRLKNSIQRLSAKRRAFFTDPKAEREERAELRKHNVNQWDSFFVNLLLFLDADGGKYSSARDERDDPKYVRK
jgi:hypothetical protein